MKSRARQRNLQDAIWLNDCRIRRWVREKQMKLLPKEPTPEMWEKAWNSTGDNEELDELEGAINTRNSHVAESFCGSHVRQRQR